MSPRSRITITLYVILVFASGILVGIESHRLYATNYTARANTIPPQTMGEFRRRYLEGMRTQVGVNAEQIVEINAILEDTKRKVDELSAAEKPLHDKIQQDHIDQIKALLTPDQRVRYEAWRAARAKAQREAQRAQQK